MGVCGIQEKILLHTGLSQNTSSIISEKMELFRGKRLHALHCPSNSTCSELFTKLGLHLLCQPQGLSAPINSLKRCISMETTWLSFLSLFSKPSLVPQELGLISLYKESLGAKNLHGTWLGLASLSRSPAHLLLLFH